MLNRRDFLIAAFSLLAVPGVARPASASRHLLSWPDFVAGMKQLASGYANGSLGKGAIPGPGLQLLNGLNIHSHEFMHAVKNSVETGNRFWLWQRLVRETDLNGGILQVSNEQDIPLHDHPGATGMLRILEGQAEVWQYNSFPVTARDPAGTVQTELRRVSHRILNPGDVAVLTPDSGNIHTVRSLTRECRMLDFFIPPYNRRARSWYEPEQSGWRQMDHFICTRISENEFHHS